MPTRVSHVLFCITCCYRDFVSIRHVERSGGRYYSASKGIVTTMKPEQPGKVRSECRGLEGGTIRLARA